MDSNNTKMLQAILSGQKALEERLANRIDKVEGKLEGKINSLDEKLDKVEKRLTNRIDRIGRQLAYLEDDTPTREEHDKLEKRVEKLEQKNNFAA